MRDNLRVKEVRLDGDEQRRFIVCHNPDEQPDHTRSPLRDEEPVTWSALATACQQPGARLVGGRGEQAKVQFRPRKPSMGNIDESIPRNAGPVFDSPSRLLPETRPGE